MSMAAGTEAIRQIWLVSWACSETDHHRPSACCGQPPTRLLFVGRQLVTLIAQTFEAPSAGVRCCKVRSWKFSFDLFEAKFAQMRSRWASAQTRGYLHIVRCGASLLLVFIGTHRERQYITKTERLWREINRVLNTVPSVVT